MYFKKRSADAGHHRSVSGGNRPGGTGEKPGIVGYMVKSGDDLWTLAKQYMTTEESIRQINHLENGKIKPGDKLIICKEIGM